MKAKQTGFSLIEIMVVLIIMGLLIAGVAPNFIGKTDDARVKQAKTDLATIENALDMYKLDNRRYPDDEDEGLEALVNKLSSGSTPGSSYLKGLPPDPWGNAYGYEIPGREGHDYDVYSLGADGKEGGEGYDADLYHWQRYEQ